MALEAIVEILWRERQLFDLLLARADESSVVTALRRAELDRAVAVHGVAESLGFEADDHPTLARLAASAPPPWNGIIGRHRAALLECTADVPPALVPRSLREALT
jgi:hypothetical protein